MIAHMVKKRYFTLLELLIVISVIAILASLLLPALSSAKRRTKRLQCLNNLKQIGIGIFAYSVDYNGWPPKADVDRVAHKAFWVSSTGWSAWGSAGYFVQGLYPDYIKSGNIWYCPEAKIASYETDWPHLGILNSGNAFQQTYCFELWRRRLSTPCRGMFKDVGSSKMLGGDLANMSGNYPSNHVTGNIIVQNQLLGDGSAATYDMRDTRFTDIYDYSKWW